MKSLTLQFGCPFAQDLREVLQIISCSDSKLSHKVPRSALQISVVSILARLWAFFLGPAEVRITRDGCGTFKALQPLFGLSFDAGVEVIATEEFIA